MIESNCASQIVRLYKWEIKKVKASQHFSSTSYFFKQVIKLPQDTSSWHRPSTVCSQVQWYHFSPQKWYWETGKRFEMLLFPRTSEDQSNTKSKTIKKVHLHYSMSRTLKAAKTSSTSKHLINLHLFKSSRIFRSQVKTGQLSD